MNAGRRTALKALGLGSAALAFSACGQVPVAGVGTGREIRIAELNGVELQFPALGVFKRYLSSSYAPREDVYVMRTLSPNQSGLEVQPGFYLSARSLYCPYDDYLMGRSPIEEQCSCALGGVYASSCVQSACRGAKVSLQVNRLFLRCDGCGSEFDPETGQVFKGPADFALQSYPIERRSDGVYVLLP